MLAFILSTALLFSVQSTYAYEENIPLTHNERTPLQNYEALLNRHYNIESENFTWTDLEALLNETQPQSVEQALSSLYSQVPSLFQNYVLMYRSRSLQTSSFLYPRALLINQRSDLIVSFNGHEDDHGYQALEVMSFDHQTDKFSFKEIQFFPDGPRVSKDNPRKCLNCHQSARRSNTDPRPNWEPYNLWPGAYGSVGHGSAVLNNWPQNQDRYDAFLSEQEELENPMYHQFLLTVAPTHARYSLLEPMQPFSVTEMNGTRYFPFSQGLVNNGMTTRLTHSLTMLNMKRVARLIREHPLYPVYKYSIFSAVKCRNFAMPEEVFQWHQSNSDLENEFYFTRRGAAVVFERPGAQRVRNVAELIHLIFEPLGTDTSDWSMDFGTGGRFSHSDRFTSPQSTFEIFNAALRYFVSSELAGTRCDRLKERSLETLHQYYSENSFVAVEAADSVSLMSRCISCHSSENSFQFGAPWIPFESEDRLARALQSPPLFSSRSTLMEEIRYRLGPQALFHERMPANGYQPSHQEVDDLLNYLEGLH
jgi:hypothetical protein